MPRIRPGMKKPPPGFEVINDVLDTYEDAMKLALQAESDGVVGQTSCPRRTKDNSSFAEGKRRRVEGVHAEDNINDAEDNEVNNFEESSQNDHNDQHTVERIPPLWRIAKINYERTRYVFDAFFRLKTISKEVYDYCCEMQFIDVGLLRRWRLPGYEHLCCTSCGVPGAASVAASITSKYALRNKLEQRHALDSTNQKKANSSTCICRVPISERNNRHFFACTVCGCRGCCSTDVSNEKKSQRNKKKNLIKNKSP
ncbi:unnamed protein product [Phytomonas sp. Hart1]|nr:unnamed protein product [Phytomonas sp. Hart1]|eukprot:CCW69548.1 unnamed protein product [Phytomonas sp. isolate Hart1]